MASLSCFDERMFENEKTYREKLEWKQSLNPMETVVGGDVLDMVLSFVGHPKNAMHDALDTFDELCNNEWFADTPILLFMNKSGSFSYFRFHFYFYIFLAFLVQCIQIVCL